MLSVSNAIDMALLHGHRRSSRTPLLAIASLAGAVLIFRFSFASRPSSVQSAVGILDSKEGYSDYFSSHARSLAEQLILKKKENDGDRGSNSASSNKKVDPNQGIDLGDWTQPLRDDFATYENEDLAPSGLSLAELEEKMILSEGPVRLCPECKCDKAGSYAESSSFTVPIPTLEKLRSLVKTSRSFNDRSLLRYLLHHIQLQSTLDGLYVPDEAISWLLTNHFTCPDNLIAFNFDGLKLDKPTSYIYTRTGPGGKLAKWEDRGRYMKRHVGVIKDYQDLVSAKGFWDGVKGDDRQLLWLVVEDEANLEPQMEVLLRDSGIPFLYFAHGPTRHFGKAQWNIVMRAIEVLRDGFFGDGPVLNLDDDCRIVPELLSKIWKVSSNSLQQSSPFHTETDNIVRSRKPWCGKSATIPANLSIVGGKVQYSRMVP